MDDVTVNGRPWHESGYGVEDSLGRSAVRPPRSVRASASRYRDLGASKAKHNRDDDKVWNDWRWNQ